MTREDKKRSEGLRGHRVVTKTTDDLHVFRADDRIRTGDPHLGKVMLYQLSHVRAQ